MRVAIGIATLGRPKILLKVTERFKLQSRQPDAVLIAPVSDKDVSTINFEDKFIRVYSEMGLSKQRNSVMYAANDYDLIAFFDDDLVLHKDCLKNIEAEFEDNPNTVIAHGNVVIDGAKVGGISFEEACRHADNAIIHKGRKLSFTAYGFMAIRLDTVRKHNLKFEERFPSYSWMEDLDFSRQIVKYGECIQILDAVVSHIAYRTGRTSGVRFGYSQVANPLYIAAKKSGFTYFNAYKMFTKNFIANATKSIKPEPHIDRKGRLKGNLIAFKDLVRGKLDPERIENL